MSALSVLQILLQISIVISVRTNHYQLQVLSALSIGKKILSGLKFELMNEYPFEIPFLLFSNRRILCNSSYLLIQDFFSCFGILFVLCSKDLDWYIVMMAYPNLYSAFSPCSNSSSPIRISLMSE